MEKIYYILIIAILATSCKVKNEPKEPFRLDPNATILLRPAKGVPLKVKSLAPAAEPVHLTALEIVKQTETMCYTNIKQFGDQTVRRGFADAQRDFEIPALKMWGTDIIDQDGNYQTEFIESENIVLVTKGFTDTIAYIPNSVIKSARVAIKAAYDANNTEEVYKLFNTAFTFTPMTGAEWRALKDEGKE